MKKWLAQPEKKIDHHLLEAHSPTAYCYCDSCNAVLGLENDNDIEVKILQNKLDTEVDSSVSLSERKYSG